MNVISRDKTGLLVKLSNPDLNAIGITNHGTEYYDTKPDEVDKILKALIQDHHKATRLILQWDDLPTILRDGLQKLNDYAEARARVVMQGEGAVK